MAMERLPGVLSARCSLQLSQASQPYLPGKLLSRTNPPVLSMIVCVFSELWQAARDVVHSIPILGSQLG